MNNIKDIELYEFNRLTVEEKLNHTYCLTDHDYHNAWEMYVDNPNSKYLNGNDFPPVAEYKQCNPGAMIEVGKFCNMPVCITINWLMFNRKYFAFWEATSQVVDHRMIDAWFKERYSGNKTNSSSDILTYILEARRSMPDMKMDEALR